MQISKVQGGQTLCMQKSECKGLMASAVVQVLSVVCAADTDQ